MYLDRTNKKQRFPCTTQFSTLDQTKKQINIKQVQSETKLSLKCDLTKLINTFHMVNEQFNPIRFICHSDLVTTN